MNVSIDTRTIQKGDYFIPIKGPNFDGRDFIPDAIAKGAHILDVDIVKYAKKYRKKLKCRVIGITGSAGKTTMKDMLASILSQRFNVVKTQENQNNEIGVPLTVLRADADTDVLIVEMAIRKQNDMPLLAKIVCPTDVIITGIGMTHIELLKTQKNIAKSKAKIFQPPKKWESPDRKAFINYSSPYTEIVSEKAKKSGYKVFPFTGDDKPEQALNAAVLVAKHFGLGDSEIEAGLAAYTPSSHRLNWLKFGTITLIDDTYNANPDGVEYALHVLKRKTGRKIFVLGDMGELGETSESAHQQVEKLCVDAGVQLLATVGTLSKNIHSNTVERVHFSHNSELAKFLKNEIKSGDTVLLKGSRSMTLEEVVKELSNYFESHQ
jgi:UDP-N-acetylmuramoyl-tripeptide--D-alanyl-D-alanine ligase